MSHLDFEICHSSDDIFNTSLLVLGYHTIPILLQELDKSVTDG